MARKPKQPEKNTAESEPLPADYVPSHGFGVLHPWQPGQSGNPAGRPPKRDFLALLHERVEEEQAEIVEGIVEKMKRGDHRDWAEYRNTFYGMPKQAMEITTKDDPQRQLAITILQSIGIDPASLGIVIEGEARELET